MLESDVKALLAAREPLVPQETMGRNDRCWCRSGRKWKNCHRERSQQLRNISELLGTNRQEQRIGYCVHPDASKESCSGRSTDAHTVQKENGLQAISEKGHVISVKKAAFGIGKNEGQLVPVSDGIGKALPYRASRVRKRRSLAKAFHDESEPWDERTDLTIVGPAVVSV